MSNTGNVSVFLSEWMEVLRDYEKHFQEYVDMIETGARKVRAEQRNAYIVAIQKASASIKTAGQLISDNFRKDGKVLTGAPLARVAFPLLTALSNAYRELETGKTLALAADQAIKSTGTTSYTYSSKLKAFRAARGRAAGRISALSSKVTAEWSGQISAASPAEVSAEYQQNSSVYECADLYAKVLAVWSREGVAVKPYAEQAIDEALSLPPNTAALTRKAVRARSKMHPIEAMGFSFGLHPVYAPKQLAPKKGGPMKGKRTEGGGDSAPIAIRMDLTLPQASSAVYYDHVPLTNAKAASAFGPLASMYSGLNYRLITRLNTIRTEPIPSSKTGPVVGIDAKPIKGRILRTIDGGKTFHPLALPALGDRRPEMEQRSGANYTYIGGGPAPRVVRLGEMLEHTIAETPQATIGNPLLLMKEYLANVKHLKMNLSREELKLSLIQAFKREYDATSPQNPHAYHTAVLGGVSTKTLYRTYIARVVAKILEREIENSLIKQDHIKGAASLFGSTAAALRGGRQEALLTSLSQLRTSIIATRQLLASGYESVSRKIVERIYGDSSLTPELRRQRLMKNYRALVARLTPLPGSTKSRVIEKLATIDPQSSIKLYALLHGDTTRPS